jgi:hypothetical protein
MPPLNFQNIHQQALVASFLAYKRSMQTGHQLGPIKRKPDTKAGQKTVGVGDNKL